MEIVNILGMMISDEELAKERIPLAARDYCAHLLVDLNRCRRKTYYLPFKCTEEKHEYEQCLYKEYRRTIYGIFTFILIIFSFLRRSKLLNDKKNQETQHN